MPDRPLKPSAMPGVVETVDDMGNPILVPLETAQRLGLTSTDVSGVPPQPQGAAAALQSVLGAPGAIQPSTQPGGAGASAPVAQGPAPVDIGTQVVRTDAAQQRFDSDRERGGRPAAVLAEQGRAQELTDTEIARRAEARGIRPELVFDLLYGPAAGAAPIEPLSAEEALGADALLAEVDDPTQTDPAVQGIPQIAPGQFATPSDERDDTAVSLRVQELARIAREEGSGRGEAGQAAESIARTTLRHIASGEQEATRAERELAASIVGSQGATRQPTPGSRITGDEQPAGTGGQAPDIFAQAQQGNLATVYGLGQALAALATRGGGGNAGAVAGLARQLGQLLPQIQGLQDEEKKAFETFLGDLQKTGADTQRTTDALSGIEQQAAQQLDLEQIAYEKEVQSIQEEHDQRIKDMEQAVNEFSRLSVDPNRLFGSADMATRFSASLGIAVGEALKTAQNIFFPGANATNTALNLVNTAIERDIAAQQDRLRQGAQVIGARQGLLAATQSKFENEQVATSVARAALLKRAELQVSSMIHEGMGRDAVNKMQTLVDQLRQQRLAAELAAKQAQAGELEARMMRLSRGGGPNIETMLKVFDRLKSLAEMGGDQEPVLSGRTDSSGLLQFAPDFHLFPQSVQNASIQNLQAGAVMRGLLNRMEALLAQSGTWTSPEARQRGAIQGLQLVESLRKGAAMGSGASAGAFDAGLQALYDSFDVMNVNPAEVHVLPGTIRGTIRELRSGVGEMIGTQVGVRPGPNYPGGGTGGTTGARALPPGVRLHGQ